MLIRISTSLSDLYPEFNMVISKVLCLRHLRMCASLYVLYVSVCVYAECHLYEYLCVSSSDFRSNFVSFTVRSSN